MMLSVNIREIRRLNGQALQLVLPQISFNLNSGNIYTIIGKNGSGKTTLLKSLTSLLDKRFFDVKGEVLYNDIDLLKLKEEEINALRKKEIKYVLQDAISSFDPLRKLGYYFKILEPDPVIFKKLLDDFSLPDEDNLTSMHPYELSGGMAQRLALVLALSVTPSLLLLDEPNSAIDSEMSKILSETLRNFVRVSYLTVVMTTQDIELAERTSDFIGYLEKGKFSGFSSTYDFFNRSKDGEVAGFISAYRSL